MLDTMSALPEDVGEMIGRVQYAEDGDVPVEQGYIWTSCASVENGNPLYWDPGTAAVVTTASAATMCSSTMPCALAFSDTR